MTNKKKQVPCLAIPKVSLNWRNVTICITVSAAYFYCQQRGGKWNESTRKVLKSHSGSLSSVQALFSSQVIIWSRRQIDVVKRFANRYCEGGTNTRATPPPDTSIMGGQPWLPKLRSCGHFATKLTIIRCQDHTQYTRKSRFVFLKDFSILLISKRMIWWTKKDFLLKYLDT